MAITKKAVLFGVIVITFSLAASAQKARGDETAKAAIQQQIDKYLQALNRADVELAAQVWRTSGDVTAIHPAGHAHNWEEIKGFYGFFGATFSERKLTARDVKIHVNGNSAWVEFYWHFTGKQKKDGSVIETDGRETEVWEKLAGRWRLVHVHYSSPVAMPPQ